MRAKPATVKPKFLIRAELDELMRTERGKFICPLCHDAGWGGFWWDWHRRKRHVQCPDCFRVFLESGLKNHQRYCKG